MFRIFQESLTNIVRHARATSVTVQMTLVNDCMVMRVRDNGIGFRSNDPSRSTAFGLLGMRERARALDGSVIIHSEENRGATVIVSLPLKPGIAALGENL